MRKLSLCLCPMVCVLVWTATASALTFQDETFNLTTDWTYSVNPFGSTNDGIITQETTGGNPGSYLQFEFGLKDAAGSSIVGYAIKNAAIYDPLIYGAIASIDYSMDKWDQRMPDSVIIAATALIYQDGKHYVHSTFDSDATAWTTLSASSLDASSFWQIDDTTGAFLAECPDFSASASSLWFGVAEYWIIGVPVGATRITGVDNWSMTVNPVPEPATILLIGTGLVGFGVFRKKFKK